MHARFNYVDLRPERFDDVDPFWREVVAGYEGLVRGYFLRDGETARTLSVVLFDSEARMRANTGHALGEVVRRAAAFRLGEPELHQLEVCAEVASPRPSPIGCARVARVGLRPDRVDAVIAGWPKDVARYRDEPGFRGGMLCCERDTGTTKSLTFWGSRGDVESNERSGAFQATVDPYREMIAIPPARSCWDVRIVVGG